MGRGEEEGDTIKSVANGEDEGEGGKNEMCVVQNENTFDGIIQICKTITGCDGMNGFKASCARGRCV